MLLRRGVLNTTLCDKVCQWLATGQWFSPGTLVSSTNKTDRLDIAEILLKLKVALNIINKIVGIIFPIQTYCLFLLVYAWPMVIWVVVITHRPFSVFVTAVLLSVHFWAFTITFCQNFVILPFVSDLQQVSSFLRFLRFRPPIKKTDCHDSVGNDRSPNASGNFGWRVRSTLTRLSGE